MTEGDVVALTAIAIVIEHGIRPLIAPPIIAPSTGPRWAACPNCLRNQATGAKPRLLRHGETPSKSRPSRITTMPATICRMPWNLPNCPVATSTAPTAAAITPITA
jgi:hypothetical protein